MDEKENNVKKRGRKPKVEESKKDLEELEKVEEKVEDKDEEKGEEIVENSKPKKSKRLYVEIIILLVVVILTTVGLVCLFMIYNKFRDGDLTKPKVQLKYTETEESKSDGTYIVDVSDVVENVMPSIVAITSKTLVSSGQYGPSFFGGQTYATGAGSGIIVSQTDDEIMILTNCHVIEGASELSVQFINEKSVDAYIKGSSETKDVAIIAVKTKNMDKETMEAIKIATIGDSTKVKVGNGCIAIGNALGYGQAVTTGVISAVNRVVQLDNGKTKMLQIDAAINGGNSGGALLNSKGEVIGINSAKYSSSSYSNTASIEGMGFAIPISDVSAVITNLMNGETVSEDDRAALGITGSAVTDGMKESYKMPNGVYIAAITAGSGADAAGLEIGNIITQIDDKEVLSVGDIQDYLLDKKVGDKVKLKVSYPSKGKYESKEVTVTLGKYPKTE